MKWLLWMFLIAVVLDSCACATQEEREEKHARQTIEHEIKVTSDNIQCNMWWSREGMHLDYRNKDLHRLYLDIGEKVCGLKYPKKLSAHETKDPDWVPNDGEEDYE